MGDDDEGRSPGRVSRDGVIQVLPGVPVEVVRRLIEQDDVVAGPSQADQRGVDGLCPPDNVPTRRESSVP